MFRQNFYHINDHRNWKEKMNNSAVSKYYTMEQVARKLDLSQKRIRDYEKDGFINPARQERTNNRLFTDADIDQLKRVHYLVKKKGFTIKSLQQLFRYAPCWEIFDCRERGECVAFDNPHDPCWKMNEECKCERPCESCVVYLMRSFKKERLLAR
jgi:hypothetical protein